MIWDTYYAVVYEITNTNNIIDIIVVAIMTISTTSNTENRKKRETKPNKQTPHIIYNERNEFVFLYLATIRSSVHFAFHPFVGCKFCFLIYVVVLLPHRRLRCRCRIFCWSARVGPHISSSYFFFSLSFMVLSFDFRVVSMVAVD